MADELERLVEVARLIAIVRSEVGATIGSPKLLVDDLALSDCARRRVEMRDARRNGRPALFGFGLWLNLERNIDFERLSRLIAGDEIRPVSLGL